MYLQSEPTSGMHFPDFFAILWGNREMMQSISIQGLGTSHVCIPVFMEGSWFLNPGKDYSLKKNIALLYFIGERESFFCFKPLRYLCLSVILNEADFCKNNSNLRFCIYLTSVKYIQHSVNHNTLVTNIITHLKLLWSELFTIFADC